MISANGVEYKNVPEQVQYLTEQVADIWTAIAGINPPDLTLYALKTYVDAADSALGTRITNVESSIGTLLTKTEAANTYAKIADIGTYINLSDYVKTVDMYTYVQSEIQNFDLDSNTDFTALKSRVSNLESSVSSMTSDIADANATAANAQTVAGNAANTANNASAVATNAYNTATNAASDVSDMQTTINNYDSRIDAVESTVNGFQASLTTAQNTANAALAKADSALSMIAGLHSLTKQEAEFEGDNVTVTGFVEGSLCTLTKLEGNTKASENLSVIQDGSNTAYDVTATALKGAITVSGTSTSSGGYPIKTVTFNLEANKTYYIKEMGTSLPNNKLYWVISNSNWSINIIMNDDNNKNGFVYTPTTDLTLHARLNFSSSFTGTYTSKLMIVKGETAPTEWKQGYSGLKSVSISGLSSGGGVVITTSEGTTSLVPTLDDDTLELRSWCYIEQSITDTSLVTTYVEGSGIIDLGTFNWNGSSGTYYIGGSNLWGSSSLDLIHSVYYPLRSGSSGDNSMEVANGNLIIHSTASPTGYLVYKRATPVTTVLATVTYTDVSAFFETGAAITVNNANTEYDVESTSTMYGYVAE